MRLDKAKLIIINYRIYRNRIYRNRKYRNRMYGNDFAERCKKALEASFGEVPLPKCLTSKKKN